MIDEAGLSLWNQLSMSVYRRLLVVVAAIAAPVVCAAASNPDIEHGKTTFDTMCGVCHSVTPAGGPTEGPNLLGLVGREAASEPEFPLYTDALKASRITWSTETLDKFLANPMAQVRGTSMPMLIQDDKTRADVVAYLATLKK
ncbi:MAG: c-type cytochrome [Caulobacteraceae bacterium]